MEHMSNCLSVVMAALLAIFPSCVYCYGGSIFAVPDSSSTNWVSNSNNNVNNALTRSSRSLFPAYYSQPLPGFGQPSTANFGGSSGDGANNFNANFNSNPTLSDNSNSVASPPQQQSYEKPYTPYRSPTNNLWDSQNFWWSSNVPAVSKAVRKSIDAADLPSYSSSNDNNNNNQQQYSSPNSVAPPAYNSPSSSSFPEQPPTQDPSSFYSNPPTTSTTTASVYTTPAQQESTSAFSSPPSSSTNAYFSSFSPNSYQQQQQQQQQPSQQSEPSYVQSPYRNRLNQNLDRVLAGRQNANDYNSLFSSFDSVPGFKSTPWTSAPTAPAPSEGGSSSSNFYSSSNSRRYLPTAPPTSPSGAKTTAGNINPTQTAFKQGGHLVTYTTVKKKFLKTTISKHNAKADFQQIFENIGDPNLKPGEYMDGPFKRREGDDKNPAVSLTEQDPLNSQALQQALVDKHNVLRASVEPPAANMMKMVWNEAAAKKAAEWTAQCNFAHDPHESRRSDHFKCGQNLARGVPDAVSWDTVIQLWFEEKNYFEIGHGPKEGDGVVGHYTQLVWAQSFELGCAHTACSWGHYYVCNYCPVGNVKSRKYEPYKVGDKGSMCPGSSDENGLCSNYCMHANDYGNCDELEQTNNICMRPDLSNKCAATCNCRGNGKLY